MNIEQDILLSQGAKIRKYKKGEFIFLEGKEPSFYFQIIKGKVKMFNTNFEGKEFIQGIFTDNNSFGEPPLMINEPYPANAITLNECQILRLPKNSFLKFLEQNITYQKQLIKVFARRIYNKSVTAREIINNPPELRIIGFLNSFKKKLDYQNEKILVPYTRQEIANLTGLRVETVIRTLKKMHDAKKVEIIQHKLYY